MEAWFCASHILESKLYNSKCSVPQYSTCHLKYHKCENSESLKCEQKIFIFSHFVTKYLQNHLVKNEMGKFYGKREVTKPPENMQSNWQNSFVTCQAICKRPSKTWIDEVFPKIMAADQIVSNTRGQMSISICTGIQSLLMQGS